MYITCTCTIITCTCSHVYMLDIYTDGSVSSFDSFPVAAASWAFVSSSSLQRSAKRSSKSLSSAPIN